MQPSTKLVASALIGAASLVFLPTAHAQGQMQQDKVQKNGQGQTANPAIPDEKLNAVAAAIPQVASIKQNYQPRIEAAPLDAKQPMIDEATNAMTNAITSQGLSVDEYSAILEVARNDPAVRQTITQRMHSSGN